MFPARFTGRHPGGGDSGKLPLGSWTRLAGAWGLTGTLDDPPAHRLASQLFRCAMAICHAPEYQRDHQDALAQDWAHLPVPRDRALFDELVRTGDAVAQLLDPEADAETTVEDILTKDRTRALGVVRSRTGTPIKADELRVTVSYFGAARGRWLPRPFVPSELPMPEWGPDTGDLYVNEEVYFANVPTAVWAFELGGYPVIRKWLGYRHENRCGNRPLTLAEVHHVRSMIQRIAALLVLHPRLDALYQPAAANAFTAEDLGLRS